MFFDLSTYALKLKYLLVRQHLPILPLGLNLLFSCTAAF